MTEQHEVKLDLSEVGRLNERISEIWADLDLAPEMEMPVCLAFEEALSNILRHAGSNGDLQVTVTFTAMPEKFTFELHDTGPEFNPLEVNTLDPNSGLDQRRAGGMGIFLVKKLADDLGYQRRDGWNCLTFRKNLAVE